MPFFFFFLGSLNNVNNYLSSHQNNQEQLNQVTQYGSPQRKTGKTWLQGKFKGEVAGTGMVGFPPVCPGSTRKRWHGRTPLGIFCVQIQPTTPKSLFGYKVAIALSFIRAQGIHERREPGIHSAAL